MQARSTAAENVFWKWIAVFGKSVAVLVSLALLAVVCVVALAVVI